MMELSCDAAREALWPDPDKGPPGPARAHYDACPSCRRFFRTQARLGERLAHLARPEASAMLRARVRLGSRRRRRRPALWGLAAAAAAAITFVALAPKNDARHFVPAATWLADMPMDTAMDRSAASAWLSSELAMDLELPELEGAEFMGADLVMVDDTRWAGARYDFKGMPVAYFALPMDTLRGDTLIRSTRTGTWEVAVWHEDGGPRALAGRRPLTRDDVMALADECRRKAAMRTVGS